MTLLYRPHSRGFVLSETVLVLLILGLSTPLFLAFLLAFQKLLSSPQLKFLGERVELAPCFAVFPRAIALHQALNEHLKKASAVYAFGGLPVPHDSCTGACSSAPLLLETFPLLGPIIGPLPCASAAFYSAHRESLGEMNPRASQSDFSLLLLGEVNGGVGLRCFVQCEVVDGVGEGLQQDRRLRRYRVRLWDYQGQYHVYLFAEPLDQGLRQRVGLRKTWLRREDQAHFFEEGPAQVSFPDPWLWAGSDRIPSFSRFTSWLPSSR